MSFFNGFTDELIKLAEDFIDTRRKAKKSGSIVDVERKRLRESSPWGPPPEPKPKPKPAKKVPVV